MFPMTENPRVQKISRFLKFAYFSFFRDNPLIFYFYINFFFRTLISINFDSFWFVLDLFTTWKHKHIFRRFRICFRNKNTRNHLFPIVFTNENTRFICFQLCTQTKTQDSFVSNCVHKRKHKKPFVSNRFHKRKHKIHLFPIVFTNVNTSLSFLFYLFSVLKTNAVHKCFGFCFV